MKVDDYRVDYYAFSSKTSEIARQLSFAGIALLWLFKPEDAGPAAIPEDLLWPAGLFVLSLSTDLLHAAYGTLAWGAFARYHEKKNGAEDPDIEAPAWLNWPTIILFWSKVVAVIAAYAITFSYIRTLISAA